MIHVLNLHEDQWEGRGIYVGRPAVLGNPFVINRDGPPDEVVEKYRRWLWEIVQAGRQGHYCQVETVTEDYVVSCLRRRLLDDECYQKAVWEAIDGLRQRAALGETLNLLCYCKPLPCHADVIQRCLEWLVQAPALAHG